MICHSGLITGALSVAGNKKTSKECLKELSPGLVQQVKASTGLSPVIKMAATAPGITSSGKVERKGKAICQPPLLFLFRKAVAFSKATPSRFPLRSPTLSPAARESGKVRIELHAHLPGSYSKGRQECLGMLV